MKLLLFHLALCSLHQVGQSTTTPTPVSNSTSKTLVSSTSSVSSTPAAAPHPKKYKYGPTVTLKSGQLRPLVQTSRKGREYFEFRGIPYAAPPITFQRFKLPSPVKPWEGVLNATKFAPPCIQYNVLVDAIEGEEDCLFLNVFTPKVRLNTKEDKDNGTTKYPVLVFIHQGAFMFGNPADYGGTYLMDQDVVLVTIAYRLGSFGFLNTEGESDALGNAGLKDQVLALQWIQDNIHVFNGDKSWVTIMGESAGAASVHYHLLSNKSVGLFSRAISLSGTALSPWAFSRRPREAAVKLGTMLNCPTTVMYELFICLQSANATDLAKQHKAFFEWGTDPIAPFGPSVEVSPNLGDVFMNESPYHRMASGEIADVPWMLGVTEDVCLLDAWSILLDKQLIAEINVEWHRVAPLTFSFRDTAREPQIVANQIQTFYFGSQLIGNATASNLTNLYGDRLFNWGTRSAALLHGRVNEGVPLYLFTVGYQGAQSHLSFLGIKETLGVSEGDELQYLFHMDRFSEIGRGHVDEPFSDRFISLLLSFVREGRPVGWGGDEWKPMSQAQVKGDEALRFYRIAANCTTVDEPFMERMSFWDNLPLNEMENELGRTGMQRKDQGEPLL